MGYQNGTHNQLCQSAVCTEDKLLQPNFVIGSQSTPVQPPFSTSLSQMEVNGHHDVGRSREKVRCGDHVRSLRFPTLPDKSAPSRSSRQWSPSAFLTAFCCKTVELACDNRFVAGKQVGISEKMESPCAMSSTAIRENNGSSETIANLAFCFVFSASSMEKSSAFGQTVWMTLLATTCPPLSTCLKQNDRVARPTTTCSRGASLLSC